MLTTNPKLDNHLVIRILKKIKQALLKMDELNHQIKEFA